MAKGTFRCPKCDRSFSMAAHLARHTSAIHGARAGGRSVKAKASRVKAKVRRRKGVGKKVRRQARPSTVRGRRAFGSESARLLKGMQAHHSQLVAQRTSLDAELDAIAGAIEAMGARASRSPAGRSPKRGRPAGAPPRAGSLKDYIVRVLRQRSRPMSPRDIGVSVVKAGLKTKAKDVTKAVSNTLPDMKNVKKVGFGVYRLTG